MTILSGTIQGKSFAIMLVKNRIDLTEFLLFFEVNCDNKVGRPSVVIFYYKTGKSSSCVGKIETVL